MYIYIFVVLLLTEYSMLHECKDGMEMITFEYSIQSMKLMMMIEMEGKK